MKIIKGIWYLLITVITVVSGLVSLVSFAAIADEDFRKEIVGSKAPKKKYGVDCYGIEIEDSEENEFSDMEQFMFKRRSK